LLAYSPWNQAKAEGKITLTAVGPVRHLDPGGYFEARSEQKVPNYKVIEIVSELIERQTKSLSRA
jgi:hypothetical protein